MIAIVEVLIGVIDAYVSFFLAVFERLSGRTPESRAAYVLDEFLRREEDSSSSKAVAEGLDMAKKHLVTVLNAIDTMKEAHNRGRAQLAMVAQNLREKETEVAEIAAKGDAARRIMEEDREQLRDLLGIRRGRIEGFFLGVVSSLVAASLWWGGKELVGYVAGLLA